MSALFGRTSAKLALLLSLTALLAGRPAAAVDVVDDPVQIDDRLTQVMQASNSLCWEMYRYHQQQAGYPEAYRAGKEIWSKADELRNAVGMGPMETAVLAREATDLNQKFIQLEKTLAQWGPGDQSSLANAQPQQQQRTVVRSGVEVDLPLLGFSVGGAPTVITEDRVVQLQRIRLHVNAHGSKRSLEREIAAVKVAMNYLMEDAGASANPNQGPTPLPGDSGPTPIPPNPEKPLKVQPIQGAPIPANPEAAPRRN